MHALKQSLFGSSAGIMSITARKCKKETRSIQKIDGPRRLDKSQSFDFSIQEVALGTCYLFLLARPGSPVSRVQEFGNSAVRHSRIPEVQYSSIPRAVFLN